MRHLLLMALGSTGLLALLSGCEKDPPSGLWNPTSEGGGQPTVSSIVPPSGAYTGVSIITINGTNFSPVKEDNAVYFDGLPAVVLQASAGQLVVKAPFLVRDSLRIKIQVRGSALFSEPVVYKLEPPVIEFAYKPYSNEEPVSLTCDKDGNVYVSILPSLSGPTVVKILPTGQRSDYAPGFSSSVKAYSSLKLGPGGYLYAGVNFPFIFRMPPGGGTSERWFPGGGGVGKIYDFDFDQQGNIWAGGNNSAVYRIKPDKSSRAFPFVADVRSVRVFNGYVYVAGQTFPDSLQKIVRFQLVGDSLGPAETYFDFSAAYPAGGVYAITFAADGNMFVGTDSVAGTVVLVHPDRTSERFYPGWFTSRMKLFAYGASTEMYAIRTGNTNDEKRMLRIFTQKTGAPYYGRP